MNKEKILSLVRAEKDNTIGVGASGSKLSDERTRAIDYSNGVMDDLKPSAGMSKVVHSVVHDVVEGAMPDIMDIFTSSEKVAEFIPVGEDDVEAAQQETDAVNHVFYQENEGFMVLYQFIKDALLVKNGFVKTYWEEKTVEDEQTYTDMDEQAFSILKQEADSDEDVELKDVEFEKVKLETEFGVLETKTYTGRICRKSVKAGVKVVCVPPEEVYVSQSATTIQGASLVRHERLVSRSDLIAMGIDKEVVMSLPKYDRQDDQEELARDIIDAKTGSNSSENKITDMVQAADNYILLDHDDSGITERWHIMTGGKSDSEMLDKTRIDRVPMATATAIPIPHEFYGKSLADLTMDLQRVQTFLTRQALDNAAFMNNGRVVVSEDQMTPNTIDDIMLNQPSGVVEVSGDVRTALMPVPNQSIAGDMINLVNYFDDMKQARTGVTDIGQGIDPDALNPTSGTARGATLMMNAAQKKIKLYAKVIAETGIRDMMINIHWLLSSHQDKEKMIRMRGKWEAVHPNEWKERESMSINVALGSGDKSSQLAALNNILERQVQAISMQSGLSDKSKVYHTLDRMVELTGFSDGEAFFNRPDPNKPEPPKPPSPEQQKMQMEMQKQQMEMQLKQQELQMKAQGQQFTQQLEMAKAQADVQLKNAELNSNVQLKTEQLNAEVSIKMLEMDMQAEIEGTKVGIQAGKDLESLVRDPQLGGDKL